MKDASCFLWAPGLPRGYGSLCMPPGFTRSCLGGLCSLVWAGFPFAPEGFNAVLSQLARWFYPFGSGAHCNNYYYYYQRGEGPTLRGWWSWVKGELGGFCHQGLPIGRTPPPPHTPRPAPLEVLATPPGS